MPEQQQPWHAIEEQAYHAYREWPIWLALRRAELALHLQATEHPGRQAPRLLPGSAPNNDPLREN